MPGSGITTALTTTRSVPATGSGPDEGIRAAEMAADALKVVPSDSIKVVGLEVAVNQAEVKSSLAGN